MKPIFFHRTAEAELEPETDQRNDRQDRNRLEHYRPRINRPFNPARLECFADFLGSLGGVRAEGTLESLLGVVLHLLPLPQAGER